MSAFMCSPSHINVLVSYANDHQLLGKLTRAQTFKLLVRANVRSLKVRYGNRCKDMLPKGNDYAPEAILAADLGIHSRTTLATTVLKLAQSFDYQACEAVDHWGLGDKAHHLISMIQVKAIEEGAIHYGPSYDAAPWSL